MQKKIFKYRLHLKKLLYRISAKNNHAPLPSGDTDYSDIQLVKSGDDYFKLLEELIDNAREVIHLQVYIFDPDQTGKKITEALLRARKRDVRVYIVLDDFGSKNFGDKESLVMQKTGIHLRRFSRAVFGFNVGKRLHHKVVVADRQTALIGGINIADRYSGYDNKPAWLDYAVLVNGAICIKIEKICERIFFKKKFTVSTKLLRREWFLKQKLRQKNNLVSVSENDWFNGKFEITYSYRQALRTAQHSVCIVASYFLPGFRIKRLIRKAAQRNVKIKIIVPGKSDVPIFLNATRYLYNWMLRNNFEIYEWQPSVLHAKAAIVDGEWATVGSYNLMALSDYGSLEVNLEIRDKNFISSFQDELEQTLRTECKKVEPDSKRQQLPLRFFDWVSFQLVRLSMRIYLFLSAGKE